MEIAAAPGKELPGYRMLPLRGSDPAAVLRRRSSHAAGARAAARL
jgi:hypothetical protein